MNIGTDIICKGDADELYGEFTCVINPEGYNFTEGAVYEVRGQGGIYFCEETQSCEINFGGVARDRKLTYGYNLHRYITNY